MRIFRSRFRLYSLSPMIELLRTNDPVVIAFIETLMRDAGIPHLVLDTHMSIMEGSIGVLPRRIMIDSKCRREAEQILRDAGLENELKIDAHR